MKANAQRSLSETIGKSRRVQQEAESKKESLGQAKNGRGVGNRYWRGINICVDYVWPKNITSLYMKP